MILGRTHSKEMLAENTGKNNIQLPAFHKSLSFGPRKFQSIRKKQFSLVHISKLITLWSKKMFGALRPRKY